MFRLLRLVLILPLVFLAGILWERNRVNELCARVGGDIVQDVCTPRTLPATGTREGDT